MQPVARLIVRADTTLHGHTVNALRGGKTRQRVRVRVARRLLNVAGLFDRLVYWSRRVNGVNYRGCLGVNGVNSEVASWGGLGGLRINKHADLCIPHQATYITFAKP